MPTKKKPTRSPAVVPTNQPLERQFGSELVRVEAAFRYPDIRKRKGECVRLALQLKAVEQGRRPTEVDPGPTTVAYDLHDNWRA